jgi:hypothetical protein
MGQRANYIIKNHEEITIHYTHWRANCIAADLYLGEKRFIKFVEECQLNEEILNEPWIEGCVIIDIAAKELNFWSFHIPNVTSVINYFISALANKWQGWTIRFLNNRMYDVEKILGIDYISKQDKPKITKCTKEEVLTDRVEDWTTAWVIIKSDDILRVTKTGMLNLEAIVSYGQDIIELIEEKPEYELPNEEDETSCQCLVIDTAAKRLFMSQSEFGLWEQINGLWEGYVCTMGDFGYIETLQLAGIDTANLVMAEDKVMEQLDSIVNRDCNFDPYAMAGKLTKENNDIQFHPDFFDSVRPQKTFWDNLKKRVRNVLDKF